MANSISSIGAMLPPEQLRALDSLKPAFDSVHSPVADTVELSKPVTETVEQSGKGFWNWLTKTTKGKWTMAGVALAAVAAGTWAYLAHKNKSADELNEVA